MTKKENLSTSNANNKAKRLLVRIQKSERVNRMSQNIVMGAAAFVMIGMAVAIVLMKRQHVDYKVAEEAAYAKLNDKSTYEELQAYVVNFKGGKHYDAVAKRFKRMTYIKEEWELAEKRGNAEAYTIFLEHYPYSFMSEEAHRRRDSLIYLEVLQDPTPTRLEAFIEKYPNNTHIEEVKQLLSSTKMTVVRKKTGDYLCANFYHSGYRPTITLREIENNVYEGLTPCRGDTLMRFRIEFTKRLKINSFKLMGKVPPKVTTSTSEQ